MALPASDAFTNTDGVQLTAHSASWTLNNGDFDILSNAIASDSAAPHNMAHWNADEFDPDQFAEGVVKVYNIGFIGVAVRCDTSAHTGYAYLSRSSGRYLWKFVSGLYTSLSDITTEGVVTDDVVRLEAESTTITPKLNGSEDTGIGAQTDSSISSGYAGLGGYGDPTNPTTLDSWEGGVLGAAATDQFTGTDGVQLTTYSANWTLNNGDFDIASNELCSDGPTSSTHNMAHWNAYTFDDDQYAECVRPAVSFYEMGPAVRCAAAAHTGYVYLCDGSAKLLRRFVGGSYTTLSSAGVAISDSDLLRLEVSGATLTPILNGSTDTDLGAQTDSSITSGYAGIAGYGDATSDSIDDWEGGNIGEGAIPIAAIASHYARLRRAA